MKQIDTFIDFLMFEKGEPIKRNEVDGVALVIDAPKGADFYFDDKYIRTKQKLETGDSIRYRGMEWLIVSQVDTTDKSSQSKMRRMNHITKFTIEDWLYEFPSIIEMVNFSMERGQTINLSAGKLDCTLKATKDTNKIKINARFIASDSAWKVVGVDKTKAGLVILDCDRDMISSGDDMENEIADANYLPVWSLRMIGVNNPISVGKDVTFIVKLYKNETEIPNADLIWQSSDDNIASVNNGVVHGVSVGTCTICVYWAEHPSIELIFEVIVLENVPDTITYRFFRTYSDGSGKTYTSFNCKTYTTKHYGIEKYINGVIADVNDTYTFTLNPNGVPTSNWNYGVLDSYKVWVENEYTYTAAPLILTGVSNQIGTSLTQNITLNQGWD